MTPQKEQQLKSVIVASVPEIAKRETLYRCNRVWEAWQVGTMTEEDFEEVDLSEDITFEDCIVAIEEKFTEHKIITKQPYFETFNELIEMWIMTKPLSQQTPETKQFLYDLLVKKLNKE